MELTSPESIKNSYLEILAEDDQYNDILKELTNRNISEPILTIKYLNPEDTPDYNNEQRELSEIMLDLNVINNSSIEIKNKAAELIELLNNQSDIVLKSIQKENERILDINMLCGINSEYNMSIPVYVDSFNINSSSTINDKTIGAERINDTEVSYIITNISGNGYSGNGYVYNNGSFENEELNYNNSDFIKDDNNVTAYEYSRLITNNKNEVIDGLINYDDKEVECVLTLASETSFCRCQLDIDDENVVIKNIEVSSDGLKFTSCLSEPLKINNKEEVYKNLDYIYGSGILCFPYSNYIRITVTNNSLENDTIAIKNEKDEIKIYPNTYRKKIKINTIKLYSSSYKETTIESEDLLTAGSVDKIGLFVNQYIPNHFTSDIKYLTYYLIINGTEYEVVPVNSKEDGIKLIKFSESENSINQNYVQNITETIKSAKIKVLIKTYNNIETPYISNLKLCLGKDTGSIYVV